MGPVVLVGLVGLEAKPAGGWTIRLPKWERARYPVPPVPPRPTDLTRMIVNWVCRKPSAGSEIRLAYCESTIALSII